MAVARIDTGRSVQEYAKALAHLLPPGEYFTSNDTDNIMLGEAAELARIHAKIDIDFIIGIANDTLGWTLDDYRAMLSDAGMSDFKVSHQRRLRAHAGSTAGSYLGDIANVFMICIVYLKSQQALLSAVLTQMQNHKLTHTHIFAMHASPNVCGVSRCGEANSTLLV